MNYQNHMFNNITSYDITNCLEEPIHDRIYMTKELTKCSKGSETDRILIQKDMKQVEEYLIENNVQKPKKLIQTIHKKKVQKNGQINLIMEMQQSIENKKKTKVYKMKKRNLKKININERNLLMNLYAHQYPDETKSFLNEYLPNILQDNDDTQNLIKKLEKKIDKLSNQFVDYIFQFDFDDSFGYLPNQEEDYSNDFNIFFFL